MSPRHSGLGKILTGRHFTDAMPPARTNHYIGFPSRREASFRFPPLQICIHVHLYIPHTRHIGKKNTPDLTPARAQRTERPFLPNAHNPHITEKNAHSQRTEK